MPTEIEQAYVDQNYERPAGLTWDMVAKARARWGPDPIFVPVARIPGCCVGWAVPHVDGKPLNHP
jgi:hypothetical protein